MLEQIDGDTPVVFEDGETITYLNLAAYANFNDGKPALVMLTNEKLQKTLI